MFTSDSRRPRRIILLAAGAILGLPVTSASLATLRAQVAATEVVYVKQTGTSFEMRKRSVTGTADSKLFGGCLANIRGYCAYLDPSVSPDGQRLAFGHDAVGEISCKTIWIADLDGRNARQLTMGCNHSEPSWSPDGRRIAFQDGGTIKEVELCRNTFPERSPSTITSGQNPSYSPDGRWLAFDRGANVYKIRRNGSGETPLANTTSTEIQPRWTKPGWKDEQIHYLGVVGAGGASMIVQVNADGTDRRLRVTDTAVRSAFDVGLLPSAWVWEDNREIFYRAGTTTRSLGPGQDPVLGHGSVRAASCP